MSISSEPNGVCDRFGRLPSIPSLAKPAYRSSKGDAVDFVDLAESRAIFSRALDRYPLGLLQDVSTVSVSRKELLLHPYLLLITIGLKDLERRLT